MQRGTKRKASLSSPIVLKDKSNIHVIQFERYKQVLILNEQQSKPLIKPSKPNLQQKKALNKHSRKTIKSSRPQSQKCTYETRLVKTDSLIKTTLSFNFKTQFYQDFETAEYDDEIFNHLRMIESRPDRIDPNWADSQLDLDWTMRTQLVDWMVEVHTNFGFIPETLFSAVDLLDRFMSRKRVGVEKFQLVGITCLNIACNLS